MLLHCSIYLETTCCTHGIRLPYRLACARAYDEWLKSTAISLYAVVNIRSLYTTDPRFRCRACPQFPRLLWASSSFRTHPRQAVPAQIHSALHRPWRNTRHTNLNVSGELSWVSVNGRKWSRFFFLHTFKILKQSVAGVKPKIHFDCFR